MSEKQTGSFTGTGGVELFYRVWLPEGEPSAVLTVVHGYAEHSGRYENVATHFTGEGYAVYAYDHRGHGESGGKRAYTDRFDYFVDDLRLFLDIVKKDQPGKKIFLLGHSMGGAIVALYAERYDDEPAGIILSAPGIIVGGNVSPLLILLSGVISALSPNLAVAPFEPDVLSRDREVILNYKKDPLVYHGKVKARLGAELLKAGKTVLRQADKINIPILILHGSEDKAASSEGSKLLYERVSSEDKTLRIFEGLYHEILNEPEKEEVLSVIINWLKERVGS